MRRTISILLGAALLFGVGLRIADAKVTGKTVEYSAQGIR
jgi:hypothetical protein